MTTTSATLDIGREMHDLARRLWPITRSISGDGVRRTHEVLKEWVPLTTHEVPSGTKAFDWVVPLEWNVRDAYIADASGQRVVDFQENNLHLVGYSLPVDVEMDLADLQQHLHSLPDQPDAIPYVTAYYKRYWGFCLTERQRGSLPNGRYHAVIDSTLAPGSLTFSDLIIPGEIGQEVMFSTYTCHPSMANNELSGLVVTTALARTLLGRKNRYTYRFVFVPETIGSIVYLSRHVEHLKRHVVAGWVVTCVGDDRAYSYLPSRRGDTLTDRLSRHVLKHSAPDYVAYSFLERGSDERQYCSPRIDLPIGSIMRTKYGQFPEYHTSLDDLSLVTPTGLAGAYEVLLRCVEALEHNEVFCVTNYCEPQLSKRGLYPDLSFNGSAHHVNSVMNLLAYADGKTDLVGIADIIDVPVWKCCEIAETLCSYDLLERVTPLSPER